MKYASNKLCSLETESPVMVFNTMTRRFRRPETKEDVNRALGIINFLARFMTHQSANSKALRYLIKEDTAWKWSINKPVLAYFHPQKQTKISSDSSKDPLGAVIMQLHETKWLPLAYAARSVTDAEYRY